MVVLEGDGVLDVVDQLVARICEVCLGMPRHAWELVVCLCDRLQPRTEARIKPAAVVEGRKGLVSVAGFA